VGVVHSFPRPRFPNRYHTYRIVISPLINGFHSTMHVNSGSSNECIMFICGPNVVNAGKYSPKEWEGLYSGIVFTEIDHNYINPLSENYKEELSKTFGDPRWIKKDSQAAGYGNGTAYFNEYFTHAVFLLYIKDYYTKQELATIKTTLSRLYPALIEWGTLMKQQMKNGVNVPAL